VKDKYKDVPLDGDVSDEEDSEEDEPEDENGELVTAEIDKQLFRTLSLLKAKDPRIYDPQKHFFSGTPPAAVRAWCPRSWLGGAHAAAARPPASDVATPEEELAKAHKEWSAKKAQLAAQPKPMKLKDYERKRLLEEGAEVFGQDDEDDGGSADEGAKKVKTYAEEQDELKAMFQRNKQAGAEDEDDDDLFVLREKTAEDEAREEEDFRAFLLEQKALVRSGRSRGLRDRPADPWPRWR